MPPPHKPHSGMVLYAIVAGALMMALGIVRLSIPLAPNAPYPPRSIRVTYSLMVALGLLLIALAVRWRFFA